jgi:hypothetical protein
MTDLEALVRSVRVPTSGGCVPASGTRLRLHSALIPVECDEPRRLLRLADVDGERAATRLSSPRSSRRVNKASTGGRQSLGEHPKPLRSTTLIHQAPRRRATPPASTSNPRVGGSNPPRRVRDPSATSAAALKEKIAAAIAARNQPKPTRSTSGKRIGERPSSLGWSHARRIREPAGSEAAWGQAPHDGVACRCLCNETVSPRYWACSSAWAAPLPVRRTARPRGTYSR